MPADLNAFLLKAETVITGLAQHLGDHSTAARFEAHAEQRRGTMNEVMWDAQSGCWRDLLLLPAQCETAPPGASRDAQPDAAAARQAGAAASVNASAEGAVEAMACWRQLLGPPSASSWVPLWCGTCEAGGPQAVAAVDSLRRSALIQDAGEVCVARNTVLGCTQLCPGSVRLATVLPTWWRCVAGVVLAGCSAWVIPGVAVFQEAQLQLICSLPPHPPPHLGFPVLEGICTSAMRTNEQWDGPNAWPPLQHMLIEGVANSGAPGAAQLAASLAQRWLRSNLLGYQQTGHMHEKYDALVPGAPGRGGEYVPQVGFGWSNGVFLDLLRSYGPRRA